jgi:PKD repeat protein
MKMKLNRNLFLSIVIALAASLILFSCHHEQEIVVTANFDYTIPQGGYTVPVQLTLNNKTTGADFYQWTFVGAAPSSSTSKQPGSITYAQAGTYTIKLEAWNDTEHKTKLVTFQLDSAVTINFNADVLVNDFVPATAKITNLTRGASTYEWTFEGGTPSTSTLQNPPDISYNTSGDHLITLKVSNGRETFTTSRTITLKPAMQAAFDIVPSFADIDYEAPLTATLTNKTTDGIRYTWSSTGGVISNITAAQPDIYFDSPGTYTVTLLADNDKEIQQVQQTIEVKPNSNLYKMENITLGVSAAHSTIGSFYSTKLREVLTKSEITDGNGSLVDIIFYGINSGFSYCRFVSPDSAAKFTFPAVPNNTHTYFVNTIETSGLSFNVSDFDNMVDDSPIASLNIQANDTGTSFFDNTVVPRVILFQTQDGRKGAIKVKSFVSAGLQSYITADIKIQK